MVEGDNLSRIPGVFPGGHFPLEGCHIRQATYTGEEFQFEPHPATNRRADYYKPMQDVRALIRGEGEQEV